jgi:hypothetical protein
MEDDPNKKGPSENDPMKPEDLINLFKTILEVLVMMWIIMNW